MKNILIIICLISFYSCKEKTKKSEKNEELMDTEFVAPEKPKDQMVVKLYIEFIKDNQIQLFYLEDSEDNKFTKEFSFLQEVRGENGIQEIIFEFPESSYPNKLRIDFGNKPNSKSMKIEKIIFSRKDNSIVIDKNNFNQFFSINANMSTEDYYHFSLNIYKGHYDPHMISRLKLTEELDFL